MIIIASAELLINVILRGVSTERLSGINDSGERRSDVRTRGGKNSLRARTDAAVQREKERRKERVRGREKEKERRGGKIDRVRDGARCYRCVREEKSERIHRQELTRSCRRRRRVSRDTVNHTHILKKNPVRTNGDLP